MFFSFALVESLYNRFLKQSIHIVKLLCESTTLFVEVGSLLFQSFFQLLQLTHSIYLALKA